MATKPLKILQASAGSGKTFSLTAHYLTLLLSSPNKYREILAVTFTNKATEEMKTRILEVLHGFATGNPKVEGYRTIIQQTHPDLHGENLKLKADLIYRKILHDYSRFSISTIDKFVQKIIRSFAFELGLNSNFGLEMNTDKVIDELVVKLEKELDNNSVALNWIIELALDRINNNQSWNYKSELINLTKELFKEKFDDFEAAINHIGTDNLNDLFKNYVEINKLKLESFQENIIQQAKQAQEIFELSGIELADLKGKSRSPLTHLVKVANGTLESVEKLEKLIDQPEEWGKENVVNAIYYDLNPILNKIYADYQQGFPEYALIKAFNKNIYYLRLIIEIAGVLKTYREESGTLLISDTQKLLNKFVGEMGENPSFIMEKMGQRYKNYLFDEFQDTSLNQWNTFRSLLVNALAEPSEQYIDHLVVGDTKQAIYRWRNGDWNILHSGVKESLGIHQTFEATLEENYRSSRNIINFNNFIFKKLPLQIQNLLNQSVENQNKDILQWWASSNLNHIVTDIYQNAEQKTTPYTPEGGTIKINKLVEDIELGKTNEQSISLVIEEIKVLIFEKQYKQGDLCVLVRKNTEALFAVEKLMEAGFDVVSGDALTIANNRAIQLIINTLRVFIGTVKNTALYKANCISLYAQLENKLPQGEDLFNLDSKSFSQLANVLPTSLCENWFKWAVLPLPELVENLIECYQLSSSEKKGSEINLPYLLAFRDLLAAATQQGEKGISAFLTWWEEDGIKKTLPSSETANAIQVMTIHKSKGLAFRAVFIPFCEWDLSSSKGILWVNAAETPYKLLNSIPLKFNGDLAKSTVNKAYFEEVLYNNMDALNSLYVATTRSKDYLFINYKAKKATTITNIGDVLNLCMDNNESDFIQLLTDEFIAPPTKTVEHHGNLTLNNYPTSNRLSELFVDNLDNPFLDLEVVNQRSVDGKILHEILATCNTLIELEATLYDFVYNGIIKDEDRDKYYAGAKMVLNQPEIQSLYANADKIMSEQSIIDMEGKSHRPDKLIFKNETVHILDFKFTKKQDPKHVAQVQKYIDLLNNMGYKTVKGYLFYQNSQSLIALNN